MWGQGTRGGAHVEHEAHCRGAGRVEAHRLVEHLRELPSESSCDTRGERGVHAGRAGGWKVGELGRVGQGRARKRCARGGAATGGRARATDTINMPYMYVTLDVSKLTSWLKFFASCRVETRECETRVRCAEAARRGSWGAGGSG